MSFEESTIVKLARKLNAKNAGTENVPPLPPLVLLTDCARQKDPIGLVQALPEDSMVIIRDYDHPNRLQFVSKIATQCHKKNIPFLVASDAGLAEEVGAAGIHLPAFQWEMAQHLRRKVPEWMITVSAHSKEDLERLSPKEVDAALLSPLFPTGSHPGAAALGLEGFREVAAVSPVPLYALGGITEKTALRVRALPVVGLACVTGLEIG